MQGIKSRSIFKFFVALAIFLIFILLIIRNTVKEIKTSDDTADNKKENSPETNRQKELAENPAAGKTKPKETNEKKNEQVVNTGNLEQVEAEKNKENQESEPVKDFDKSKKIFSDYVVEGNDDEIDQHIDDRMPSAYLRLNTPKSTPDEDSYCKFNYGLPKNFNPDNAQFPPEENDASPYRALYDVVQAYNVENVSEITFVTQMTANFAYYIPELLRRWTGLISVAAFVPGSDIALFLEQINKYCYCEPEMYRVSIHFVVLAEMQFPTNILRFGKPSNCVAQDSSKIKIFSDANQDMMYPINVGRNIARFGSITKHILVADVQLMPSKNLAEAFLKFQKHYKPHSEKEVFALPEFEITESETIPETKKDLVALIKKKTGFYFHETACNFCHKVPNYDEWIGQISKNTDIKALVTVKRQAEYNKWEPVYISENTEPLFPEKLSWNGLADKMAQALEMCLQDYDFTILDNAFLVHWPGLQNESLVENQSRRKFIVINNKIYNELIDLLKLKYTNIEGCGAKKVALSSILPRSKPKANVKIN